MPRADQQIPDDAQLTTIAETLGRALVAAGVRLAVAESCTGGWIAKALTDIPGSSAWFEAGFVTYSNEAKRAMLGVSRETLIEHGAVSEPVVRAMTAGARRVTGADAAIAVSGIAGPEGGSDEKPVGLVQIAWSLGDRDWCQRVRFDGDREAVRRQAVELALTAVLEALPP